MTTAPVPVPPAACEDRLKQALDTLAEVKRLAELAVHNYTTLDAEAILHLLGVYIP